jgi:hypothetical protein
MGWQITKKGDVVKQSGERSDVVFNIEAAAVAILFIAFAVVMVINAFH